MRRNYRLPIMVIASSEPRLVVPEGLVLDESARERLERQLAPAPDDVAAIGAAASPLAPGASYRVHAEWTALETPDALAPASGPVRGAVLVRPGVEFAVRDGRVEIASGTIMVDPGAHTHAPHDPIGVLEPASERGRPPFPRRPVVVFLAVDTPADDWLIRLVNRLVRRDVEARIAAPDVSAGLHLTRPCRAGEASIRALAPDVVVTLDAGAAASVDAWCEGDRSTVVVAFDPEQRDPMELVSWQIGRAAGRLRARIGPHVDAPAFASLVGRLCAGPHPMPPVDRPAGAEGKLVVRERWTERQDGAERADCVIVTGVLDSDTAARVDGLADNLEAAGVPIVVARVGTSGRDLPQSARDAAVVVLAGAPPGAELDALLAERSRAGRPTVLDVGSAAVEAGDSGDAGRPRLTVGATALAEACGLAVAVAGARFDAAAAVVARSLCLPTLLSRGRAAALRDARPLPTSGTGLVIGWRVGANAASVDAAAEGIAAILTMRPDQVEIVGEASPLPAVLRDHARVSVVPDSAFTAEVLAGWAVQVWTPALVGGAIVDDGRVLEEASLAGVPTVLPAVATAAVDGFVSPFVQVLAPDRGEEWANALHHVLDDPAVRAQRATEAQRRAEAVDGLAAAKATVSRFMGWATYRVARKVTQ
jgi:hypothetical protein